MPRRASPAPTTRTTRRSAGVSHFLSLDLYSKGNCDKALTYFNADENHNGIRVDTQQAKPSPSAASSVKRRSGSVAQTNASLKRMKRSESDASSQSSVSRESSPAPPPPPSKRRGRPPGSGNKRGKTPAAAPKTPKKEQVVVKQELMSDEEQPEEPVVAPPRGRGRPRKSAGAPAAASDTGMATPHSRAASRARSDYALDQEDEEAGQQPRPDRAIRAALEQITAGNNPQLSSTRKREVVSQLDELVRVATSMTPVCYDLIMANLKAAEQNIVTGKRPADTDSPQTKVTAAESEKMRKQLAGWAEKERDWKETEKELNRMITMGQATMQQAQQETAAAQQETVAAQQMAAQLQQDNVQLMSQLQTIRSQLEQVQKQQQLAADRSLATVSSSSSSAAGPSTSRGRASFPHSQMLMPHTMAAPSFNMQQMPRGSAIGQSHMAGRADELISGLANVAGMENSMASVAVTAATMPEFDANGNPMQRTIRTRVERIAVTEDMNLEELTRMGFQVVSVEGGEDEGGENGALIEEMHGGGGEEAGDFEEAEPLIEEAE